MAADILYIPVALIIAAFLARRAIGVAPGALTILRVGLITAGSCVLSLSLPGHGLAVVPKLLLVGSTCGLGLVLSGEIMPSGIAGVWQGSPGSDDGLFLWG